MRRPGREVLSHLLRARNPASFHFGDEGETPNNPKWPLVIYRAPVKLRRDFDPAAIFEELFASKGWVYSWRDDVYGFHSHRHEVLGIARGSVQIAFGGARGRRVLLRADDVAILPAGTGHRRSEAVSDLLVVGAYPQNSGDTISRNRPNWIIARLSGTLPRFRRRAPTRFTVPVAL